MRNLVFILIVPLLAVAEGFGKAAYDAPARTITVSGADNDLSSIASDVGGKNVFEWDAARNEGVLGANLVIAQGATLNVAGKRNEPVRLRLSSAKPAELRVENNGILTVSDAHISSFDGKNGYRVVLNGKTRFTRAELKGLHGDVNSWANGLRLNSDDIVIDHCRLAGFLGGYFSFGNYPRKSPSIISTTVEDLAHSYVNYGGGNPEIRDCEFSGSLFCFSNTTSLNTRTAGFNLVSGATLTTKHYLDVVVLDDSGRPVAGAEVSVIPDNGGKVELGAPLVAYHSQLTGADGHTPLPGAGGGLVVTGSVMRNGPERGKVLTQSFTYTIQARKDGRIVGELAGVAPDDSWYRRDPDKPSPILTQTIRPGKWTRGKASAVEGGRMIANLRTVLPRCRFPMMLLVDDGCPLINPLYYERSLADRRPLDKLYFDWELKDAQVPPGTRMVKDIPLAFIEEYADWAYRNNVRGKFTVIPFPGGQGSILEGWAGGDKKEIDRWLGVVREKIAPICDIAPECITHVCALDIESGKSLPIPEWEYTAGLSVEKLTDYILFSLETLRKADLTPTGFAHPHRYKGDLRVIARAVASAMNKLNGTKLSFYWTGHTDVRSPIVRPSMMHYDRDSGQAVVGFPVACEEPMWKCITGAGNVSKMADYYISSDGASGKFVEWVKHDSYLIFYVHWEALYGNGTKKGFQTVQEIVRRANEHLGEKVLWMKTSEAARYFAASQTCEVVFSERQGKAVMIFTSPFDCPDFTVSFEINSDKKITVLCDNKAMLEAPSRKHLKENCWFREGKTIYLCLPLGQTTRVEIEGL